MEKMRLKHCPWCGWNVPTLVIIHGETKNQMSAVNSECSQNSLKARNDRKKSDEYFIRCDNCGSTSKKSRFKWRTRWFWNHMNHPLHGKSPKKRFHIYGEEF